jgi:hypothetical protein
LIRIKFWLGGIKNLTQLGRYRWCDHGVLMGKIRNEKVSIEELRSSSRRKEVSGVRAMVAIGLVKKKELR